MRQSVRSAPIQKRPGRPSKHQTRNSMGISANVERAIGFMVNEGLPRREAAEKAGISDSALYQAFRQPEVVRHYNAEGDALRTMERARNTHALLAVRDRGMVAGAPVGASRALIEAVKVLEGEHRDRPASVTVNVTAPGYAIEFGRPRTIDHTPDEIIFVGEVRDDGFEEADH